MNIKPPKIDQRKHSDLVKELQDLVPHYTPEWPASDKNDAGVALLRIFGYITENIITRLNQVPHKNFVAFLDMLGIKLLSAQPARVPVTFKLAKGTDKEILIPARTQAAADKTEEHEELPFETEKNLLAIPSQLKKVISVDPDKDAIYLPPPGFLEEKAEKHAVLSYTIVSSPATGSKNVQLDHVTDLEKGDFMKIVNGDKTEYVIISDIAGTIVSFTERLLYTHLPNTTVEKLTKFNLFKAKDMQEHSLYIGHKDLFNVKSAAQFKLLLTHQQGTTTGVTPLKVSWEYWGKIEGEEEPDWHQFNVIDHTNGLSKDGSITLIKTTEGEIKEEEIKEIKSRWIRGKLKEQLTPNKNLKLPFLDTISIRTESRAEVKPDKAFYQDVPLNLEDTSLIRNMLALDIQLKLTSLIVAGSTTATLEDTPPGGLRDGDLIEFNNGTDPPERRVIEIEGIPHSILVFWTDKLLHAYDATAEVKILTAIRAKKQTPIVRLESIEGLVEHDRITLIGTETITAEIQSILDEENAIELNLDEPVKNAYIVGDVMLKGEGIPRFPFGKQPKIYDTFSISSQEAFSKKGAVIEISLDLKHQDNSADAISPPNPQLSWEYWDGKGWQELPDVQDSTNRLLNSGENAIRFIVPDNITETQINGQKDYWVRARIVGGDYGRDMYTLDSQIETTREKERVYKTKTKVESKYKLPVIRDLKIKYLFKSKKKLQQCLTYNNLEYLDQTEPSRAPDKYFSPFLRLEDPKKTLYLGFEKSFTGGPVKIFFAAKELPFTEEKKPKLAWTYSTKESWNELSFLDATEGLIKQEILELLGPSNLSARAKFSNYLYWLKANHTEGEYEESPLLDGIFPNTTWAFQAETIKDEILGSSDGEPDQTFSFFKFPVLEGQQVRVRETLSAEEKQTLINSRGDDAIFELMDETGDLTETWVLWTEVPYFSDSAETDRHYTLDRAIGEIQFGDGIRGMIPPAGDDNIKTFSYQAGGGSQGNVKAGEIKTLKSAVAGVKKAGNPVDAGGGANTATLDQMLEIGPAMISHRNRAVTMEDFEWLARQASRKIAKVRCLPNTNNRKENETGWVTVIIVPDSLETRPSPTLELRRKVQRYLKARSANTLSSVKHIYIAKPTYVEVDVSVDIFITLIDVAAKVERETKTKLQGFFHPLTGGPEGEGWDFGRDVSVSDIYALLEDIDDVDHVENLSFAADGVLFEDKIEVKQDYLVASGIHTVNLRLMSN